MESCAGKRNKLNYTAILTLPHTPTHRHTDTYSYTHIIILERRLD